MRSGKGGPSPRGAAPGQGRTHTAEEGGMPKCFFFVCAAGNRSLPRIICYIKVAQVGIEGEINAESVWPLRFLTPRLPESRSLCLQCT